MKVGGAGFQHAPAPLVGPALHASHYASGLRPSLSAFQLLPFRPHSVAYEVPLPAVVEFDANSEAPKQLADVLRAADRREAAC
jgi:hypothetical protein